MNTLERQQLIDALLDGDLSEADFLRLEAELTVDRLARQEYYERIGLTLLMENEATRAGVSAEAAPLSRIDPARPPGR